MADLKALQALRYCRETELEVQKVLLLLGVRTAHTLRIPPPKKSRANSGFGLATIGFSEVLIGCSRVLISFYKVLLGKSLVKPYNSLLKTYYNL